MAKPRTAGEPRADEARMAVTLERLVALDTENPPGRELEAARFLAAELESLGLSVDSKEFSPGRANVWGRLENGPGPVFCFNSHIDVVPAGEGWSRAPFKLVEQDGRLYGRGACDAKGPIVAMLEAARLLAAAADSWRGTLLLVFVADEEVASLGAKDYVKDKPGIDFAVIGEPTSNAPVIAHKGSLRPIVRVAGRTAHSGTPE
ncbi:MAG: M20/M25/M40 family metallo-hydrolase, partial [Alphaproteobacteria bacterium]